MQCNDNISEVAEDNKVQALYNSVTGIGEAINQLEVFIAKLGGGSTNEKDLKTPRPNPLHFSVVYSGTPVALDQFAERVHSIRQKLAVMIL